MNLILIIILGSILAYLLRKLAAGARFDAQINLHGKNAIITGGNTGIGKQVLLEFARLGCNVIIGARDHNKSRQAVKQAQLLSKGNTIEFIPLDLAQRQSIQSFCATVQFQKIDYLINNAGLMTWDRMETAAGIETTMAVNHFGPFLLTSLLWARLRRSEFFRVINVSSLCHKKWWFLRTYHEDIDDLNLKQSWSQFSAYSKSKLCNVLFTRALASKIDPSQGLIASLHPGTVQSEIYRGFGICIYYLLTAISPLLGLFMKTPQEGSQTILFAALSPDAKNGCYYAECKQDSESVHVHEKNWNRLWEASERVLSITFNPR